MITALTSPQYVNRIRQDWTANGGVYGDGGVYMATPANNPFAQLGPTLDLVFAGTATDPLDAASTTDDTLSLNFTAEAYQIAAQYAVWGTGGLQAVNFADIVTFTRGSNATQFDSSGNLVYAPNNAIRNNTMVGAVAGTPGTLPTNWQIAGSGTGTLTREIVGTGVINGITYIDIKFTGTISTASFIIACEPSIGCPAASAGQTWTGSNYVAIVGGNTTNITAIRAVSVTARTSGGAAVGADAFDSGDNKASLTSTLQRFSASRTLTDGTTAGLQPGVTINLGTGTIGDPINGITLRIGLPQLEIGPTATAVNPTSGTAYYGPRLDYNPSTLAPQGLLIEEQRTNLLAWSASFRTQTLAVTAVSGAFTDGETVTATGGGTGTYYAAESTGSSFAIYQGSGAFTGTLTGATSGQTATISSAIGTWSPATQTLSLVPNIAVAPTGTSVGANWTENTAATTTRSLSQSVTITAGQTVTTSLFVKQKPGAARHFRIQTVSAGANGFNAYFNLTTGTVAIQTAALGTGTAVTNSATITPVGNGWYRISASGTVDPAATVVSNIGFMQDTPSGTAAYTGDGTSGLYIWGAQVEAGAFPTSYIPTTTTALTRNADQASVNTLSPWFNATEGTLFAESVSSVPSATLSGAIQPNIVFITDGTSNNRIGMFYNTGNVISGRIVTAGATANPADISANLPSVNRSALAYAVGTNQGAFSVNTSAVTTSSPAGLPVVDRMTLGAGATGIQLNGHLRRVTYYPRRLANADLQTITA